jgi:hypothetical protein
MIHSLTGLYLFYRQTVKDDQGWGKNVACLIVPSLNEQAIVEVKASRMQGQFSFKESSMAKGSSSPKGGIDGKPVSGKDGETRVWIDPNGAGKPSKTDKVSGRNRAHAEPKRPPKK